MMPMASRLIVIEELDEHRDESESPRPLKTISKVPAIMSR